MNNIWLKIVFSGLDETIAHIVATTPELHDFEESMESQHSNRDSRYFYINLESLQNQTNSHRWL